MMKTYERPVVSVDTGLAEGVYAASGAGTLTLSKPFVWDLWSGGGRILFEANWSKINGNITLTITFNDTIDEATVENALVTTSYSNNTVTLTYASTVVSPLTIGIKINHGTSINDLQISGYTYSVN